MMYKRPTNRIAVQAHSTVVDSFDTLLGLF